MQSGISLIDRPLFSKAAAREIQNLNVSDKCELLKAFWPNLEILPDEFSEEDYSSFFRYIGRSLQSMHSHESEFACQNFESLFNIVAKLRDNRLLKQKELIELLEKDFLNTSSSAVSRSIELGIRLWLCFNVYTPNGLAIGASNPRDSRVEWSVDKSLEQVIVSQFIDSSQPTTVSKFQIDDDFTLSNLKRICRLHIRWTNNLKDHLRLEGRRGQRSLSVYHHKILLVNHRDAPDPVIPKDVLHEAIRTLDLLLPKGDLATEELLEQSGISMCGPYELGCNDLAEYKYWGDNLAQLLELYNGPPESLFQTFLDTRNLGQWATLWIAIFGIFILTLLFGILATVYSIRQYRVAVDSYEIAVKSFELSLAVACQQKTAPLPGFCD
ncbi:hypothetical protein FQN49_003280 [Arthroderma sp. PD_2]|nr:hypothetical protein FQN49_003280 [Arthroderma sp. PD_2]